MAIKNYHEETENYWMLFGGRGYFSFIIQIKRLEKTSQVLYETFSRFQLKFSMKLPPSTSSNTSPQEKIGILILKLKSL